MCMPCGAMTGRAPADVTCASASQRGVSGLLQRAQLMLPGNGTKMNRDADDNFDVTRRRQVLLPLLPLPVAALQLLPPPRVLLLPPRPPAAVLQLRPPLRVLRLPPRPPVAALQLRPPLQEVRPLPPPQAEDLLRCANLTDASTCTKGNLLHIKTNTCLTTLGAVD